MPITQPDDLRHQRLLHLDWDLNDVMAPTWRMWLMAAGVQGIDFTRGPVFSMKSLALQAAVDGQGLALGSDSLASDDLAAGRLVRPFEVTLPVNFAYYLVYPRETAERPKIAAFRDWILAETAR